MKIDELMTSSGVGFGTSGARGTVEAMTNEVCYAYTAAFIQAMESQGRTRSGDRVFLAGDLRPSTGRILAACVQAVKDKGYEPVYCGRLPSPAIAAYAMHHDSASIMVTGSHIPDDRNGIKFNRPDGEILKPDEEAIRAQAVELPEYFPEVGETDLPAIDEQARNFYLARYTEFFDGDSLEGMRIGVYQHSGVARDLLVEVLEALGAEAVPLARSEVFIPVDTEAIREEEVLLGRKWAQEYGFDAVVSTDGDADRPLIADEKGEWLRGDIVGVLCADYLGIDNVVTPVSSNTAVEASGLFKRVSRTRIGSPYVIAAMAELLATDTGSVAGYEANGGFLLASPIERGGQALSPLPTRDAVLPIVCILAAAKTKAGVSSLVSALPARYTASDRLKNFPTEVSKAKIASLSDSSAAIEAMFGDLCGVVSSTDDTDGLRIIFASGDIVHLRPSGNAPELRCYNEAGSLSRTAELNAACMQRLSSWVGDQ